MNYKKLVGLGVLVWVTAFIVASAFVAYGSMDTIIAKIVVPVAVAIAAYFSAKSLHLSSAGDILKYSAGWVVIGLVLDLVVTVPFTGWSIFAQWNVWLGYVLILLVPLLAGANIFGSQTPGRTPQL